MANNFAKELIRSMSDLAQSYVNQVKFDRTITCQVKNWDKTTGKYLVVNGKTEMLVGPIQSEDEAEYKKNDYVLVLLPEGNISSKSRRIVGKADVEEDTPVNLSNLFAFTPVIHLGEGPVGDVTFNPTDTDLEKGKAISTIQIVSNETKNIWMDTDMDNINTMAFSFELLTKKFPINYNAAGKEYAIWVELGYNYPDNPKTEDVNESENPNTIKFAINSSDLIGSSFGHVLLNNKQQILFDTTYDIDNNIKIDPRNITSYQFHFISKNLSEGYSINSELADATITVKNCDIIFGYRKAEVAEKGSQCLLEYNNHISNHSGSLVFDNTEKIWQYNYRAQGKIDKVQLSTQLYYDGIVYNEQTVNYQKDLANCTIHWCQYIDKYTKNFKALDIEATGQNWKTLKRGEAHLPESYRYADAELDLELLENRFKVVVVNGNNEIVFESDILKFGRKNYTSSSVKTEEKGLKLNIVEGGTGLFFDYDATTKERSNYSTKTFVVQALRTDGGDWIKNIPNKVEWYIPKELTMLEGTYGTTDEKKELEKKWIDAGNGMIKRIFSDYSSDYTITLNRKDKFNSQYTNNEIICKAYYGNNNILEGKIEVQFGLGDSQGTGWKCNIVLSKDYISLSEPDEDVEAKVEIFDPSGANYTEVIHHSRIRWNWLITADSNIQKVKDQNHLLFKVQGRDFKDEKDTSLGSYVDDSNKGDYIYGRTVQIRPNSPLAERMMEYGNFAVLRVEVDTGDFKIIDYQPLPLAISRNYAGLDGASEIIYSNQGVNPNPTKAIYRLRDNNFQPLNVEMFYKHYGGPSPTTGMLADIKTGLLYASKKPDKDDEFDTTSYELTMYNNTPGQSGSVLVYHTMNGIATLVWAQPIYFQTNYYASKIINSWGGGTVVDEEGTFVAAPVLMAGTYEERKFTGLAMGRLNETNDQYNGLFGYSSGTNTFGLKTDGSFWFGTAGSGTIKFTTGKSSTLSIDVTKFNLDTTKKGTGSGLWIDSSKNEIFKIYKAANVPTVVLNKNGDFSFGPKNSQLSYKASTNITSFSGKIQQKIGMDIEGVAEGEYYYLNSIGNKESANRYGEIYRYVFSPFDQVEIDNGYGWTGTSYFDSSHKISGIIFDIQSPSSTDGAVKSSAQIGLLHSPSTQTITENKTGMLYNNSTPFLRFSNMLGYSNEMIFENVSMLRNIRSAQGMRLRTFENSIGFSMGEMVNETTYLVQGVLELSSGIDSNTATRSTGLYIYSKQLRREVGNSYSNLSNYTNPQTNQTYTSGTYGYLYGTWKAASAISVVSDRNAKNSIISIPDNYSILFDDLKPILFKYNNGTSNRFHSGFIAQDVEESMAKAQIDSSGFAALIKDYNLEGYPEYGLRYEEFIALNTYEIQKLKARVAELEAMVKKE